MENSPPGGTRPDNQLILKVNIPSNTSALVHVPTFGRTLTIREGKQVLVIDGKSVASITGVEFEQINKDSVVFQVGAGNFEFHVEF